MTLRKKNQKKELQQAQQELKILEDDIAAAYNFLRKNRDGFFGGKKKIPLYLLFGPERFGKTTLLAQAGLNLKNFNLQSLNNVVPTKYCSFWFSQDALYVDTAGTYTKPEITQPRDDLIWQGFIKLLQKHFGKDSIEGVLVILDLPAIAQDTDLLKKTLFCVRERVYELALFIKNLPLHVVLTKCDRFLGFTEFFSLLDAKERAQPFGIAFTDNKEAVDPIPTFETKFNKLLKHLNDMVVERLQKATNPQERQLIKAFPSQLNGLNKILLEILGKIPSGQQISLSGMYFTSSIQAGVPIDIFKKPMLHALNLKEKQPYKLEADSNRSYFTENVFKKVIVTHKQDKPPRQPILKFHFNYLYAGLVLALIIGTSSIIGYKSYHKNITTINEAKHSLGSTNTLDDIHEIIKNLDQTSKSWWLKLGVNETKPLLRTIYKSYQILFLQTLSVQLEKDISSTLNSKQLTAHPEKLYSALQAYLMLGDPKKLNKPYITIWFNNHWDDIYSDDISKQNSLQQQLETVLQYPFKIELNKQIIAIARDGLHKLSSTQLIYLLLENSYINQNLNLGSTQSIPKIYTKEYFNKIYNEEIPAIVDDLPQQDWVLGTHFKLQLKTNFTDDIIKPLRELYLEKYASTWEEAIANHRLKINFKNLKQTAEGLNTIASNGSTFIELIKQAKINTNINNAPPTFTKVIDNKLPDLNKTNLDDLKQNLAKLAQHFTTIAQNKDIKKAAFEEVINHLQDEKDPITNLKTFANNQSLPLQIALQSIAKKSWSSLLETAQNHINKVWQATITPQYQKILENKYPLFKDSTNDISLNDFNEFFGPLGVIDSFFNEYIKPFVSIDNTNWSWKKINGKEINFSKKSLEVFLRAALIQKMFYSYKTLDPKVKFTLTPMSMTPDTQGFTLHFEGKKIIFTNEEKKSYHLTWSEPKSDSLKIDFVNNQGKYFTKSLSGPWALFRLIDKSNIIPLSNTKYFELIFDLNGNAARYTLIAAESINPFIPDIINNFRCPDVLD